MRLIVDSSCNLLFMKGKDFKTVSLSINTETNEYPDNEMLDVKKMLSDLAAYKGKTGTACPSVGDWLNAFEDADEIIGISLTGKLSGCYNAAMTAAKLYTDEHPDRKVFILDSLTTGPELELLAEKVMEMLEAGLDFDSITDGLTAYSKKTELGFMLGSLSNFAKNGRVNPALAKLVDLLNIKIVGRASDVGDLEPQDKCRGEKKAILQIYKNMCNAGYLGGKVRITHTLNPEAAQSLSRLISDDYPDADITIRENRGLCAFYAEAGGVLVGYEGSDPARVSIPHLIEMIKKHREMRKNKQEGLLEL